MATINDLLYNYQNTNEFVCSDGRMSVNGICAVDQQDSREASETTDAIIKTSKGGSGGGKLTTTDTKVDKILDDLAQDQTPDYFPDLGKEKKSFSWDMDKPSKVKDFNSTMKQSIDAYNSFIEENLGIPSNVQNAARVGASVYGLATGGSLAAVLGPFALPALIGNEMRGKEIDRIQNITDKDKQGDITTIDMMTYDIPTYGEPGFNPHNDAKDKADNTPTGPTSQSEEDYGYGSDAGFY